ncbi:chemotaxis protein CheW [Candidatus Kryptobacter tengchongensis]|uniref:Chemotaxis protein CheW n=1 Tax=Kryptobacter tengchongensis TaxID=1643429 RepID=A0A916PE44_KRYT1|nr:chemotaxis protein CheW [Candidatus Kryptobacter tengchongensis]CUS97288.1 purine-binding chemotaxis protein CheW [Candidatus Kryptobacter tengchongensis]
MNLQDIVNAEDYRETLQLVSFKLGDEEFGVNILQVQEINRLIQITKVPNAPDFVEGVMNLRGKIVPVINLRKRLGLGEKEHDKNTRIIVVELNDKTVGFIVDSVSEVLRVSKNVVEPPPELICGIDSEYITGIVKLDDRLMILLDLEKILTIEEKESLKEVYSLTNES